MKPTEYEMGLVDSQLLKVTGGKSYSGSVYIDGSKHAGLAVLGAIFLQESQITIHDFPMIQDTKEMLAILESVGIVWKSKGSDLFLSVNLDSLKYTNAELDRVTRLRSSILLLGSFLLRFKEIEIPFPGGDSIGKVGRRPVDEFVKILHLFGIAGEVTEKGIRAKIREELCGDRVLNMADTTLFPNKSGNNRTTLAIILAAGNRGTTLIKGALCAAEITQICRFLTLYGCTINGIDTDTLSISSPGIQGLAAGKKDFVLVPDKCELAFWIVFSCMTRSRITLRVHDAYNDMTVDDFGPLYRIQDSILKPIGIDLMKMADSTFGIESSHGCYRASDLIIENYETEQSGLVMDASLYFLPLLACARGISHYKDHKFREARITFYKHLNHLGAQITSDGQGLLTIHGVEQFSGNNLILEGVDIRGAGSLLLALLATKGTNFLKGIHHIQRGNMILDKLISLGVDVALNY